MTEHAESEAAWRPLSGADVKRAIDEVKGFQSLPSELIDAIASAFRVRPNRHVRFHAQRRALGSIGLASLVMPELRFAGLPFQQANTVHLGFVLEGEVLITPREGEPAVLGPRDASMITNWSLFDVSCVEDTRVIHVLLPEARLRERGVRVRPARFRLEGSRSLRAPIVALAASLLDSTWQPTPTAVRVAEQAMETLVLGLLLEGEDRALDRDDQRSQLRRRALEEIALRHRDPDLTPTAVAKYLGVSLRHLQRGFENSGSTVAERIAARRAESAAALLEAAAGTGLTVAEVARSTGFGSAFELRSAFRAHYGLLPSDYRRDNFAPAAE